MLHLGYSLPGLRDLMAPWRWSRDTNGPPDGMFRGDLSGLTGRKSWSPVSLMGPVRLGCEPTCSRVASRVLTETRGAGSHGVKGLVLGASPVSGYRGLNTVPLRTHVLKSAM